MWNYNKSKNGVVTKPNQSKGQKQLQRPDDTNTLLQLWCTLIFHIISEDTTALLTLLPSSTYHHPLQLLLFNSGPPLGQANLSRFFPAYISAWRSSFQWRSTRLLSLSRWSAHFRCVDLIMLVNSISLWPTYAMRKTFICRVVLSMINL